MKDDIERLRATDWKQLADNAEARVQHRQPTQNHNPQVWTSKFPEIIKLPACPKVGEIDLDCIRWRPHPIFESITYRENHQSLTGQANYLEQAYLLNRRSLYDLAFNISTPWQIITCSSTFGNQVLNMFHFTPALANRNLVDFWEHFLGNYPPGGEAFDGSIVYEVLHDKNEKGKRATEQFLAMLVCEGMFSVEKLCEMLGGKS